MNQGGFDPKQLLQRIVALFKGEESDPDSPNKRIKSCPACGRFVDKSSTVCEYCDTELGAGPSYSQRLSASSESPGMDTSLMAIFATCFLFYIISLWTSDRLISDYSAFDSFFSPYFAPSNYNGPQHVLGSLNPDMVLAQGEWWRLIGYMVLHGGPIHIFFNLSALAFLGSLVIQTWGVKRFWLMTFATGIAGGIASILFKVLLGSYSPTVGFSCALMGYLGAGFMHTKKHGPDMLYQQLKGYVIWLNVAFIIATMAGLLRVDNPAHLGGMFAGMGIALYFDTPLSQQLAKFENTLLTLFSMLAAVAFAVMGYNILQLL